MLPCLTLPTSCHGVPSAPNHVTLLDLVFMMLRCLIFFSSWNSSWPSLPHVTLLDLLYIMSCCLILSSWCYAAWSSLHPATLLDLPYRILCFVRSSLSWFATDLVFKFFSTFCCAAWPSLRHVMVLHLLQSCYTAWSCLHDATLRDLLCLMLCCWTVSAWCYDWRPLSDLCCLFFDLVLMMLRSLIFSTPCYAAWPSLPYIMLREVVSIMICYWSCLQVLLYLLLRCLAFPTSCHGAPSSPIMLHCLVLSSWCYTPWSSLPHALLLDRLCLMLWLTSSIRSLLFVFWSCPDDATLLDLLYLLLRCLAFPTKSCQSLGSCLHDAALPALYLMLHFLSLPLSCYCCFILPMSCYATWFGLHDATLLGLPFLALCCLMFSIYHVLLVDLVFMNLCCLIFSSSGYFAWPALQHALTAPTSLNHLCCLILSSWCYAAWPSLPHATLLGLPYLILCRLMFSMSYHLMLFDLVFIMLRCLIFSTSCQRRSTFSTSCYAAYFSISSDDVWLFYHAFMMLHCLNFFLHHAFLHCPWM